MALEGYTSFVIEGEKAKEVYDLIMSTKAQCQNEQEIDIATYGDSTYRLSAFTQDSRNGEKVETTAFAWYGKYGEDDVRAFSYIDKISFADNILRIDTSWRNDSALLLYFEDCGLNDYEGYYYHDCSEFDIAGTTNDNSGKYFDNPSVL